jgi:hypothetical protein
VQEFFEARLCYGLAGALSRGWICTRCDAGLMTPCAPEVDGEWMPVPSDKINNVVAPSRAIPEPVTRHVELGDIRLHVGAEFLEPVSIELDVGGADHLGPLGCPIPPEHSCCRALATACRDLRSAELGTQGATYSVASGQRKKWTLLWCNTDVGGPGVVSNPGPFPRVLFGLSSAREHQHEE